MEKQHSRAADNLGSHNALTDKVPCGADEGTIAKDGRQVPPEYAKVNYVSQQFNSHTVRIRRSQMLEPEMLRVRA